MVLAVTTNEINRLIDNEIMMTSDIYIKRKCRFAVVKKVACILSASCLNLDEEDTPECCFDAILMLFQSIFQIYTMQHTKTSEC